MYLEPPPLPSAARYTAPPNVMDLETKILKQLCRELDYPAESGQETRFTWDKQLSDQENVEALREYLINHRPAKMRRGKKPEGITRFPIVFDLWSLSLVESSQFKRIAKYAGVDFSMPLHAINPGMDDMYQQGEDEQGHEMQHDMHQQHGMHQQHDIHMVPPPGEVHEMSRMLERGMEGPPASLTGTGHLNHGVPQPPGMADHEMQHEHAQVPMAHEPHGHDHQGLKVEDGVPPIHVDHRSLQHNVTAVDHQHPLMDHGVSTVVGHLVDDSVVPPQDVPQPILAVPEATIQVMQPSVPGGEHDGVERIMSNAIVSSAVEYADQQCA
jgi:hypothetical protein